MPPPFHRILCPIEFDDNSMLALDRAAKLATALDATLYVLHVVPMVFPPAGAPVYLDIYRGQEAEAKAKLEGLARHMLSGVNHELLTHIGEPAPSILGVQRRISADLLVISTHGRRGLSHFFLGSVAEEIVRRASCAVLTVKRQASKPESVGAWMTQSPVVASPTDVLSLVQARMHEGGFRCVPIVEHGKLVGIVTDTDLARHYGELAETEAKKAMSEQLTTVTPESSVIEASQILRDRKIGALPVVKNGLLVGVITTTDVLGALAEDT